MTKPIRYICISDLHIGQDQSVLTAISDGRVEPGATPPVLNQLMACLSDMIERVGRAEKLTLILLGDAIELALAELDISARAFERFAERWTGNLAFDRVIYIPGNHDHHVWEQGRSDAYLTYLSTSDVGGPLRRPRHTTPLTADPVPSRLMQTLIGRALSGSPGEAPRVEMHYPSFVVSLPDKSRAVAFNHGHYFESIYELMSSLFKSAFPDTLKPSTIEELERQNSGWIEFVWSLLGRQGAVGEDVEALYDSLAFPEKLDHITENLADAVIDHWHANAVEKYVSRKGLEWLAKKVVGKIAETERASPSVFSSTARAGLVSYLERFLIPRTNAELGQMPANFTLVWGHTHEPFESTLPVEGLASPAHIYNCGGWVADPAQAIQPNHGGALIVLDEALNAASVRFYNESANATDYRVRVMTAAAENPLSLALSAAIEPQSAPYSDFSRSVATQIHVRRALDKAVLDGEHPGTHQ